MKHIHTVKPALFIKTLQYAGCGECQTSCQSACKTSCTVGNQICENTRINKPSDNRVTAK